jgi:hypothetical protein
MLESITFKKRKQSANNNRRNFPDYRGAIFGKVYPRFKHGTRLSKDSVDHPEVYAEIKKIGNMICPFKFTSIQLCKDLVSPPHIDSKNVGESCLVSFGTYKGGYVVIEGKKYNAFEKAIVFNGSKLMHWNTPIKSGTKYSLIYFRC